MKSTTTVNLACGEPKCTDRISMTIGTERFAHGLTGGHHNTALERAALYLGWRLRVDVADTHKNVVCCPFHAKDLACKRCVLPTHDCTCMGGPRWEAIP